MRIRFLSFDETSWYTTSTIPGLLQLRKILLDNKEKMLQLDTISRNEYRFTTTWAEEQGTQKYPNMIESGMMYDFIMLAVFHNLSSVRIRQSKW